jgi:hypothetical protein
MDTFTTVMSGVGSILHVLLICLTYALSALVIVLKLAI